MTSAVPDDEVDAWLHAEGVQEDLDLLEARIQSLLPPSYDLCLDAINPRSMGSASLKYSEDSHVAWDKIWTHFCDLALAGGPPHRGKLLESVTAGEAASEPAGYDLVTQEIVRGVQLTTGLVPTRSRELGWMELTCEHETMAAWLHRAVMAENVFSRRKGAVLLLPAGPTFRIIKEIKNVVVAFAKTFHYWTSHMPPDRKLAATSLFESSDLAPLIEPTTRDQLLAQPIVYDAMEREIRNQIQETTGFSTVKSNAAGWFGIPFREERSAAWFVRSAIAFNFLARREEHVLYLPVPCPLEKKIASSDVVHRLQRLERVWRVEQAKGAERESTKAG